MTALPPQFALFTTPIGRCAIAWGPAGVLGVALPEAGERALRARLKQRFPDSREALPPPAIRSAMQSIVGVLSGEARNLSRVMLDMREVPPFHRRVYAAAREIPPGVTLSYGQIAARLRAPGAARAVGQALARNPFALIVPCHRVLAARGRLGGFSAMGGVGTKRRLLELEQRRVVAAQKRLAFDVRAALEHLRRRDAVLRRLIDRVGPFRIELKRTSSLFVALAEAIVYQQLTAKAAATIFRRVVDQFPRAQGGLTPEALLGAPDAALRAAGLSQAKRLALFDLAQRSLNGELPTLAELENWDDEAIIERLTRVRGIGRWTVEMLLVFRLGRPDVLPFDDYGIKKGFMRTFGTAELPKRAELERRGSRWKPYRSVASWYLWRSLELE